MDQSEINIVESQNKNDEKLKLYKNSTILIVEDDV